MADTRTIYIRLVNEPVDAWRPVVARHVTGDVYELPGTPADPDEVWEFPPGATVRCTVRPLSEGPELVAASLAGGSPCAPRITVPADRIAEFCRRRKITELALFGSVLRDDFGPESDVDVLVTFAPGASVSLLGFIAAERELSGILGRRVDLVMRPAIAHRAGDARSDEIIRSAQVLYAA